MSWSCKLKGLKAEAKAAAIVEADTNITNGHQTEAQKQMVLAVVDTLPEDMVLDGYIGGHNGTNSGEVNAHISWAPVTPKAE